MGIYQKIFDEQKLLFEQSQDAIRIQGKLQSGHYQIDGNISSQFISGLLFVLPLSDSDSTLTINEPYESRSYVDLTLDMLKCFGIKIKQDKNTYYIKGNQKYIAHDVKTRRRLFSNGILWCSCRLEQLFDLLKHELKFCSR